MTDYLQPLGKRSRLASAAICMLAAIISLLLSLFLWTSMIRSWSFYYDGKPLWLGAVVVTIIGLAASFITYRLLVGTLSASGCTIFPLWFIQLFGLAFLAGIGLLLYAGRKPEFALEGISVALAMIFVGHHIAKSKRAQLFQKFAQLSESDREKLLSQFSPPARRKLEQMWKARTVH